jgi:hypothetical protein
MSKDALPQSSQPTETTDARTSLSIEKYDASATFYDYLTDDLENIFERGDKLRFSKFGSKSIYLPSWSTVMHFLGWTNPSLEMLSLIEEHSGVPLKVSRTARYDLFTQKGVAERSGVEIFNWLTTTAEPFFKQSHLNLQADIERSIKVGSNAGDWLSGITGFKTQARLNDNDDYFELGPLLGYLEQRCREDITFLESTKRKINLQQIDTSRPDTCWELQLPIWQASSLVEEAVLNEFLFHIKNIVSKEEYTNTQKLAFIRCYLPVYFDFYFGAFASFEVGCVLYYREEQKSLKSKKGVLNRVITSYAINTKIKSCFEALLDEFRTIIPHKNSKMTWTDLASFIPVEYDESEQISSATKLKRKKIDRMKVWRSKKDFPSYKVLYGFLDNLCESFGEPRNDTLRDLCLITMGIDRQITELSKLGVKDGITQYEMESEIRSMFTTYDKYYQFTLDKYL